MKNIKNKNKNLLFLPLIFLLYIAQLFMIVPGSDISAASYGKFKTYSFFGMSYSTIISMLLIMYCIIKLVVKKKISLKNNDLFFIYALVVFNILGLLMGNNSFSEKIDMLAKINMPIIIYLFLKYSYSLESLDIVNKLFLIINIIFIVQVPVCKLLTGRFAASTFYTYIMSEEYYGFYSSPHAFSAMLGVLSIWNLKNINNNFYKKTSVICLGCNVILMFLSGVRTYVLDLIISVGILFLFSLYTKKLSTIKKMGIIAIMIVLLFSGFIIDKLANSRFNSSYNTVEVTSGRGNRWETDIEYFFNENVFNQLLGNGVKSIYAINSELISVYINSLNIFIDLLIDNGIIGLTCIMYIYYKIFFRKFENKNKYFAYILFVYFFIGSFINNLLPYITVMTASVILLRILELERE